MVAGEELHQDNDSFPVEIVLHISPICSKVGGGYGLMISVLTLKCRKRLDQVDQVAK
jgi:hypothetical protein